MTPYQTIARTSDIPEGEGRSYEVGDRVVAVFHRNGEFFAIDDQCPHMGASLSTGDLDENYVVTCPLHGWRFDVRDGTWRDCPKVRIDSFDLRVEGDEIQVNVSPRAKSD